MNGGGFVDFRRDGASYYPGNGRGGEEVLGDTCVKLIDLGSTVWGGAAAATVLDMTGKVARNFKFAGNAIGALVPILSGTNIIVKKMNGGTTNTSDWVDLGVSALIWGAGVFASASTMPFVIGAGVVYGIYRVSHGERVDEQINNW